MGQAIFLCLIALLGASFVQSKYFPKSGMFGGLLLIAGIVLCFFSIGCAIEFFKNQRRKNDILEGEFRAAIRKREEKVEQDTALLAEKEKQLFIDIDKRNKDLEDNKNTFQILFQEKTKGFPWLAKAYADFIKLKDEKTAHWLETKPRPAKSSAEIVRQVKLEKAPLVVENKQLKYMIEYYESLFPWLAEFKDIENDEIIEVVSDQDDKKDSDLAQKWLNSSEYKKLPDIEKYQLALDRYKKRNKTKWEIGRDYERYVGYEFEQKGYKVEYRGIIDGFEDMGRDLICFNKDSTIIIQCKYWSKTKTLHEKHINQLYGTTMMYALEKYGPIKAKNHKIVPVLITSTTVSKKAKEFADMLGVTINENNPMGDYPMIKCNINKSTGEKIYHLPFDQQYDKTQVSQTGEGYAWTVKEAEDKGFRRALRWHGEG